MTKLKKYELEGLFFITGSMAEKLFAFPATVDLLKEHQIGYHTSGHSIHPTLFEFTDVESYETALQISLIRETSHINPFTGAIEGSGGIKALQSLIPRKEIVAFRAPGYCWTPPHIDAMKRLGINFDFSTNISVDPIKYKGITFYPYTILTNWQGGLREQYHIQRLLSKRETSVLTIHPRTMVNRLDWDLIYYPKNNNSEINPTTLTQPSSRTPNDIKSKYQKFDWLLRHLSTLQKLNLLRVTPTIKESNKTLFPNNADVENYYKISMNWALGFNYRPKYLHNHFVKFFHSDS